MSRALVVAALALAGCITPSPPSEADLARPAAPSPAVARPAAPPPLPERAEVEIGGTVTPPPKAKEHATVWITDGPCWQPGTRAFGTTDVTGGRFWVEVMVPQGTNLWVCGALGDPAKPVEVYGQGTRAPLVGKGAGEIPYMGIEVPLQKGKKVAPPPKR